MERFNQEKNVRHSLQQKLIKRSRIFQLQPKQNSFKPPLLKTLHVDLTHSPDPQDTDEFEQDASFCSFQGEQSPKRVNNTFRQENPLPSRKRHFKSKQSFRQKSFDLSNMQMKRESFEPLTKSFLEGQKNEIARAIPSRPQSTRNCSQKKFDFSFQENFGSIQVENKREQKLRRGISVDDRKKKQKGIHVPVFKCKQKPSFNQYKLQNRFQFTFHLRKLSESLNRSVQEKPVKQSSFLDRVKKSLNTQFN